MLFIYNILIQIISFVTFVAKRDKLKSDPLWQGRFAQIQSLPSVDIWIHAASVGEAKVIGHLIHYMKSQNPNIKIHITTMTRSGYKTAIDLYRSANISVTQFPFDTKANIKKTYDVINPKVLAVAETEIWPNLILEADARKIPIVLINGRMSAKAFKKYKLFQRSFTFLLTKYSKLFVKSENDYKRFLYFDTKQIVRIVGDMKFDAPLLERTSEKVNGIRLACGIEPESFIFVAGSTRPGEEEMLADLFLKIYKEHKTFNLIIVPRHIKRVNEIKNMLLKNNIQFKLYGSSSKHESVILVDKVGLLQNLYLAADLAFVGGTLVDIGGHNLLEPVWAGVPVVFGKSTYNVNESAEYILKNNYGTQVTDSDDLT
ncbi:MAG TPA: hypothetical protein ENH23_01730, partial [candidate division Zixibacteria bacterium]|nr:hypothetical protein [candidate division Zixibacteria bacterium]